MNAGCDCPLDDPTVATATFASLPLTLFLRATPSPRCRRRHGWVKTKKRWHPTVVPSAYFDHLSVSPSTFPAATAAAYLLELLLMLSLMLLLLLLLVVWRWCYPW